MKWLSRCSLSPMTGTSRSMTSMSSPCLSSKPAQQLKPSSLPHSPMWGDAPIGQDGRAALVRSWTHSRRPVPGNSWTPCLAPTLSDRNGFSAWKRMLPEILCPTRHVSLPKDFPKSLASTIQHVCPCCKACINLDCSCSCCMPEPWTAPDRYVSRVHTSTEN